MTSWIQSQILFDEDMMSAMDRRSIQGSRDRLRIQHEPDPDKVDTEIEWGTWCMKEKFSVGLGNLLNQTIEMKALEEC